MMMTIRTSVYNSTSFQALAAQRRVKIHHVQTWTPKNVTRPTSLTRIEVHSNTFVARQAFVTEVKNTLSLRRSR